MGTEIAEYTRTEAALADLAARYKGVVFDVATRDGMQTAIKGRAELRTYRVDLEKTRVNLKEGILKTGRLIDGEARRITAEIAALETPIDEQIKKQEKIKDDERMAAVRAEQARVEAEQAAIKAAEEKRLADALAEIERARLALEEERKAREAEDKRAREQLEADQRAARRKIEEEERVAREAREEQDRQARLAREEEDRKVAEARRIENERIAQEAAKAAAEQRAIEDAQRKERQAEEDRLRAQREQTEADKRAFEDRMRKAQEVEEARQREIWEAAEAIAKRAKEEAEAKAKAERDAKEAIENLARIRTRIDQDIRRAGDAFTAQSSSVVIRTVLADVQAIDVDMFAELKEEAEAAKVVAVGKLTELHAAALDNEAAIRQQQELMSGFQLLQQFVDRFGKHERFTWIALGIVDFLSRNRNEDD